MFLYFCRFCGVVRMETIVKQHALRSVKNAYDDLPSVPLLNPSQCVLRSKLTTHISISKLMMNMGDIDCKETFLLN